MPFLALGLISGALFMALPDLIPMELAQAPFRAMLGCLAWADSLPGTPHGLPWRPAPLVRLVFCLPFLALALKPRSEPGSCVCYAC